MSDDKVKGRIWGSLANEKEYATLIWHDITYTMIATPPDPSPKDEYKRVSNSLWHARQLTNTRMMPYSMCQCQHIISMCL